MKTLEQELRTIPFDLLYQESLTEFYTSTEYTKDPSNWFVRNNIKKIGDTWLYPKLLTFFSSCQLNYTAEGKIDGAQFWKDNFDFTDLWNRGVFRFIQEHRVGLSVSTQSKNPGAYYCALVPIIPSAFKKYHDTPYSKWDKKTISQVVNSKLGKVLLNAKPMDFNIEELMDARAKALVTDKGKPKNAKIEYKPKRTGLLAFDSLPDLERTMHIQIWCAHPEVRNEYMILDPINWDSMPEPIITGEIFNKPVKEPKPEKVKVREIVIDDPWD